MVECFGRHRKMYTAAIGGKHDDEIISDLQRVGRKGDWYIHTNVHHRLYLRLLLREARRRGLAHKEVRLGSGK